MIRAVNNSDIPKICEIYNYYIINSIITFEESVVSVDEITNRISEITSDFPWLVYEENGEILGYSYASKWKGRCAYRYSVESTVYLSNSATSKGIGSKLYEELIKQLKQKSIHAIIGGIALPNEKSVALHEKFGFQKVAHFKETGFKFNQWIDVGYWELILG